MFPLLGRLFGNHLGDDVLRIKLRHLYQNHLLLGDTGVGKSKLIRQYLDTAQRNDDAAVVFDPECEFVQEYYDAERGDIILNPLDDRCPYWNIFKEVKNEADAIAIAKSQFPGSGDTSTNSKFFESHRNGVYAFLLAYGAKDVGGNRYDPKTKKEVAAQIPETADFGYWLAHPAEEIDPRLLGSEHVETLSHNSQGQRAGILGSINDAGKVFRMMPSKELPVQDLARFAQIGGGLQLFPAADKKMRDEFVIRDWALPENRKGWIFITSTPTTQEAMQIVQAMWADLIMLRLMDSGMKGRRVWMIFEELGNIPTMSQFTNGVTRMRKRGHCIVAGCQSNEQIERLYPKAAKTTISAFRHKFLFAISEEKTSEGIERTLGRHEIIQRRQTISDTGFGKPSRASWSEERRIEQLVLASEVSNQEDMQCYYTQRGYVVKLHLPNIQKPQIAPPLVERFIPPMERRPKPDGTEASPEQLEFAAKVLKQDKKKTTDTAKKNTKKAAAKRTTEREPQNHFGIPAKAAKQEETMEQETI